MNDNRKRRRLPTLRDVAVIAAALLIVALLAWVLATVVDLTSRADALRADLTESQRTAQTLEDQVRGLGEEPMVDAPEPGTGPSPPQAIPGVPGSPGERGRQGPPPSPKQVSDAVAAFCAQQGGCRGPGPTPEQVAAAVAAFCDARGECRGPRGETGRIGETGQTGPPPSDAQVAAAVAAYCAERGDCRGAQGERGETGRPPTEDEIRAAVEQFFDSRDFYCTPPDPPGQVTGEPWRCSMNPPD